MAENRKMKHEVQAIQILDLIDPCSLPNISEPSVLENL